MGEILETLREQEGRIEAEDGSVLRLKMTIVDVKETGFSPFGGVSFAIKPLGGVALIEPSDDIKEAVKDKPTFSGTPEEGWKLLKIADKRSAFEEAKISSSKGEFRVRMEFEPAMIARNLQYKSEDEDPIYHASWAKKSSWFPLEEE